MRAYCGLDCGECPAYLATAANDDQMRRQVAEKWSKDFGQATTPADINCDGCASGSARLYAYTSSCPIRPCAMSKGVSNCAHCGEFACAIISEFMGQAPSCAAWLTEENARLKANAH